MKGEKICLLIILCVCIATADDLFKNFEGIVKDYGYPFEQHSVTTNDGYILKLFRIQHGKNEIGENVKESKSENGRPAILIQHGIADTAEFVVAHGPDESPAFYLANLGYDVWIANSRGNKYSRQHTTLNPDKDAKFWDFSFFDMIEDYKANIEFVRGQTGQSKIAVMGHSQGTSSMFSGLSTQNDWFKQRVSIFIALGSVSRLDHIPNLFLRLTMQFPFAIKALKLLNINELLPNNFITRTTFTLLCGTAPTICKYAFKILADADPSVDSTEWARIYYGHYPGGASTKCIEHYSQMFNAKKFQNFDYGEEENKRRYGTKPPHEFNLKNINIPVAKFTGTTDVLFLIGNPEDNKWLSEQLSHTLVYDRLYEYGHFSFFIANKMSYLSDLRDVLKSYHPVQIPSISDSDFYAIENSDDDVISY